MAAVVLGCPAILNKRKYMIFFLLLSPCACSVIGKVKDVLNKVKDVFNFVKSLPTYTREIKDKIDELQDKIEDKIEGVRDSINEKVDEVRGKVTDTKDMVTEKVREVKTYVVDLAPLLISSMLIIILIIVDVKVCMWKKDMVYDMEDDIVRKMNHELLAFAGKISHKPLLSLTADELYVVIEEARMLIGRDKQHARELQTFTSDDHAQRDSFYLNKV